MPGHPRVVRAFSTIVESHTLRSFDASGSVDASLSLFHSSQLEESKWHVRSASTWARRTPSSAFWKAASPPSSPTPRAPGPRRPSSPSPRTARCSSARSPSARPSRTWTAPCAPSSATWALDWKIEPRRQATSTRSRSRRFVLQKLKRDAEAYLGEKVTDAVITVPAYFNDSAAPGDQGGRRDRGPERPADRQRADGRRPGVRARQGRPDHPRLRPRWRHLRRVAAGDR